MAKRAAAVVLMTTRAEPFTCPFCGAVSHNPNDVRMRYCARCHVFMGDVRCKDRGHAARPDGSCWTCGAVTDEACRLARKRARNDNA
jgi:hypothetical protein